MSVTQSFAGIQELSTPPSTPAPKPSQTLKIANYFWRKARKKSHNEISAKARQQQKM